MFATCRTVVARLPDHQEGRGSQLARAGVRLHLSFCADCCRYLGQLEAVRGALGALPAAGVSDETRARLLARFRAWRAGAARPQP
jgi:hypothetical protein